MDKRNIKIILLGRNYLTSISTARSLGKSGYSVDLIYAPIRLDTEIVKACKYIETVYDIPSKKDEDIIEIIKTKYTDKSKTYILYPTDDHGIYIADSLRAELDENFIMPFIKGEDEKHQLEYFMRKDVQTEIAEECGFPSLKSRIIDLADENMVIPDDIEYPVFLKPVVSAHAGKSDIGKCADKSELQKRIAATRKKGRLTKFMLQEFIKIDSEIVMNGVSDGESAFIPAVIKKERIASFNRGVTLKGKLVASDLTKELTDKINAFLKKIRYVGMFDLELVVSGDKIYFGEINLRPGGPSYVYTLCGCNLPSIAADVLLGEELPEENNIKLDKTFVNDKVIWEDYLHGFIGKKEFKSLIETADFCLTDDGEDSEPRKVFDKRMKVRAVKKLIKKVIGKE